jgi:tetratricopeptide (TPR) repeat protein
MTGPPISAPLLIATAFMAPTSADIASTVRTLAAGGRHAEIIALADTAMAAMEANDEAAFHLALAYVQAGRLSDAETLLRKITARSPRLPAVKAALCKVCILSRKPDETAALFRALEADAANDRRLYGLLGDVYLQAGRAADALRAFTLFRAAGRPAAADLGVAECQLRLGRVEEAAITARRAIAQSGLTTASLPVAFAVSRCSGDAELSARCLSAMAQLPGAQAAVLYGVSADMLIAGGRLREAIAPCEKRAQLTHRPDHLLLLADLRLAAQDIAGAEADAEEARRLNPQGAGAMTMLARCRILRGDLGGAGDLLRQGIAKDPAAASAYDYLSQIDPAAIDKAARARLAEIVRTSTLAAEDRAKLLLALGRGCERASETNHAFEHYLTANTILAAEAKAAGRGYDAALTEAALSAAKAAFTRVQAASAPPFGARPTPIFIFGMPRSGTSLVEQILSSHSRISAGGELPAMIDTANDLIRRAMRGDDLGPLLTAHAPELAAQYLAAAPESLRRAEFFTDKHPLNFWSVGAIKALFPEARMIHLMRDPADTCLSIFKLRFYREYSFANELDTIAHYYAAYEALMRHWREIFPGGFLDVRYENLTGDFERRAREMIAYCGLEWEEACLEFHRAPRAVLTHSAAQVRSPVTTRAIGGARKFAEQMRPFEEALERYRRR